METSQYILFLPLQTLFLMQWDFIHLCICLFFETMASIYLLIYVSLDMVSCITDWPFTHYVTEDDLELQMLLFPLLECWGNSRLPADEVYNGVQTGVLWILGNHSSY